MKDESSIESATGVSIEVRAMETHKKAQKFYGIAEQYAFKFLMELKTLRNEKLFLQLDCKNFEEYCSKFFGMSADFLNERIKIASEFGETSFNGQYQKLGHSKSLLIARSSTPSAYLESEEIAQMSVKALKEKMKEEAKEELEKERRQQRLKEAGEKIRELRERMYQEALIKVVDLYNDNSKHLKSIERGEMQKTYHKIDDDFTKEEFREGIIGMLAYKKYVMPKDEATKDQRRKALLDLYEWYSFRQLKSQVERHKKLYKVDETYTKFFDKCVLLQKCDGDFELMETLYNHSEKPS